MAIEDINNSEAKNNPGFSEAKPEDINRAIDALIFMTGETYESITKNNLGLTEDEQEKLRGLARNYLDAESIGNKIEKNKLIKIAERIISTAQTR